MKTAWDRDREAFDFFGICKWCGATVGVSWKATVNPADAAREAATVLRAHQAVCTGRK